MNSPMRRSLTQETQPSSGFTLLEILTVLLIVGILVIISATTWLSFLNTLRLNAAQDQVYQVMRLAQSKAKQERRRWQASFQATHQHVQWEIHPVAIISGSDRGELNWSSLTGWVTIDPNETTLYRSSDDIYRVQFNHHGHVNGRLGRLTLAGLNPHKARRCVFVSTLIGTLRKARDRPRPRNGRYCY
ncbi:MAG: type II secretion system protein [Merismopedia sp. SIO2A8]|nr:type II secretion system protein [Merismopedia sp. SIO2A8]